MLNIYHSLRLIRRVLFRPLGSFKSLKSVLKINRLVKQEGVNVAFYDRYAVHHTFSEPVIRAFMGRNCQAIYIVGDLSHPVINEKEFSVPVFYVADGFEIFLRYLRIPLIVTPATDFDVAGKNAVTRVAHFFHSPVSMHYVYGDDSFDAYDIFFLVGPHHTREIALLSELRGWENREIYPAGYPKIDEIAKAFDASFPVLRDKPVKQVMFAPSWGNSNVLRSHGIEIVKGLLEAGFEVKVRPHKHSFKYDQDILDQLVELFKGQTFELDSSMGFQALLASDLLVSDWSGVAYEYAFSTGKSVVFVDVKGGQKIQSVRNKEIQIRPMEDTCRYEVGSVCKPEQVTQCVVDLLGRDDSESKEKVLKLREKYFYNFGHAAAEISGLIENISDGQ